MGSAIDREEFAERDYAAFRARLAENLEQLSDVLSRPGFGVGPMTIGSELEVHLVDAEGRPLLLNREVVDAAAEKRFSIELARYNIELNTRPLALAGHSFHELAAELRALRSHAERTARAHGGQTITIGTLPTVEEEYLGEDMLSDSMRFRALAKGARRMHGAGSRIAITCPDGRCIDVLTPGVIAAGPSTSFQVHLRVSPRDFAAVYNAVQIATAPALAVSANAPMFLSNDLWDETRIALMAQAFEYRPENELFRQPRVPFGMRWCTDGVLELFEEAVREHPPLLPVVSDGHDADDADDRSLPALYELRLHQGTVWRWNRPVYDESSGGHVRIEMRALPAGPTVVDMVANAAFMVGLSLGLTADIDTSTKLLDFADAEKNFVDAATRGLEAELLWPAPEHGGLRRENARSLVLRLLPVALDGLVDAGVSKDDAEPLLALIEARASSRRTGARWQRHVHRSRRLVVGASEASRKLVQAYIPLSREGMPVHLWDAA
jgi:gamma-glutamyl:cysteine ligase YbdK (ATP-grasp superfamily)